MNDKQRSEDQKWNEWLEENCRIQVEYPDMAEMEQQKNRILQSALPEKDSLFERLKKIYYGPGLGIIFYRCTLIWVVMILLYIGVLVLSIGTRDARQTQMAVDRTYKFHALFHALHCRTQDVLCKSCQCFD
mgnify:CR=1 FL=1